MFYNFVDAAPPSVQVDFNMTDEEGHLPALARAVSGVLLERPHIGQRVIAQDADGNVAEALIGEIRGELLELYLLPATMADVGDVVQTGTIPLVGEIEAVSEIVDTVQELLLV